MYLKVSIIIPTYNASKFISRCLDSIINQTYKNIEIIVVDDGSTDNTVTIVETYVKKDERICVIQQENKGSNIARKTGYDKSTGEYIYNIDADDFLEPNAIEQLVTEAKIKEADLVLSYHNKCFGGKKILVKNTLTHEQTQINIIKDLLIGNIKGYVWGKLYKRELLINVQIPPATPLGDDVITNLNFFIENKLIVAIVKKPLYNYVIHGENITFSTKPYVIEGTFKHIVMVSEILKNLSFYNEIKDEHNAFNCRAWIIYNRMGGAKIKDKQFAKAFYKENFTLQSINLLSFHHIFELYCFKLNWQFGKKMSIFLVFIYWKLRLNKE